MAKGKLRPCNRHGEHSNTRHIASMRAFISKLHWIVMCLLFAKPYEFIKFPILS